MPNNTEVREGTEVTVKKYFVEIIKRWFGDSNPVES
jgi:hypothetical protein